MHERAARVLYSGGKPAGAQTPTGACLFILAQAQLVFPGRLRSRGICKQEHLP